MLLRRADFAGEAAFGNDAVSTVLISFGLALDGLLIGLLVFGLAML
jgi:hypothetical protein